MIVSDYPYWPRMLRQIGKTLAVLFVLSLLSLVIDRNHFLRTLTIPEIAVGILGATLSILLAFRTNSAYARWWEARTLWGSLINNSRSLARQAISFPKPSADFVTEAAAADFCESLVYRQIAFVHALRCALRRQEPWEAIRPFLDAESFGALATARNIPAALLMQMGKQVAQANAAGILSDLQAHRMDQTLSELSNVLGGCERIKNTPLPKQYDYYPELLIRIYCIALPFVIVDDVGYFTPVVTVVVSFAFLVLNRVGKNLEDPFENRPYDVPLSALCATIEVNLRQALGEVQVMELPQPVKGVLM